jgi:exopolyphosphatase / guanosine-5'-triphosphate,3'-diphosphate pyrophosphatase
VIADAVRPRSALRTGAARERDERRAVIDIGSNTVRLVIYGGPPRAPAVLWNEKVSARLGRDLEKTGEMPEAAMAEALTALARYAVILRDLGLSQVEAVATAAPRDAANGSEFLSRVAALGLRVKVLSGEEEARASAWGAIGAFPGARGLVADLGGGSLELVTVSDGRCGTGASFPLGTLRLPALRAGGQFQRRVTKLLAAARKELEQARRQPLYLIGGTWRAFATYAMRSVDHPLTDPHGFMLETAAAAAIARGIARSKPAQLALVPGISTMRAEKLPDAAALLLALLTDLEPEALIFSSWGLREGLHYQRLGPATRASDPLLAAISAFAGEKAASVTDAVLLAGWTTAAARGAGPQTENLRLAAAQLALALHRVEPNLRGAHALEWALDKRWIGIDFAGRAILAAALRGSLGLTEPHARLLPLASMGELHEATAWGLALRLAQRLGAGSRGALAASRLDCQNGELRLTIAAHHAALAAGPVEKDLAALANWLGFKPVLVADR